MTRWALLAAVGVLISACSGGPAVRIDSRALGARIAESPERYIIAAVDNQPVTYVASAGGTPRGYDGVSAYGPSTHARSIMRQIERNYGLKEISAWPIEPLQMHCAVLEVPAGKDRSTLLLALSRDARVKLTQPLQTFATRSAYNDPYVGLQRGFEQMDVAEAHPFSRGEGVKVAIIDTGVDIGHPDLRSRIAGAANFVDADDVQFRRDRHGTEVAGVIAAVANNAEGIVGVAPEARLLVFKACWQAKADADAAQCNSFTLARAISAALDAHAQVVNLSLAGPDDALLTDLIHEGLRRGILFVGAAEQADGLMHRAGVIEVASSGTHSVINAVLYAPGQEILTLLPDGRYDFASGSSIATAQVTGVVALMLAKDPSLSAQAAYRALAASHNPGQSVDACVAVATVRRQGTCHPEASDARLALH